MSHVAILTLTVCRSLDHVHIIMSHEDDSMRTISLAPTRAWSLWWKLTRALLFDKGPGVKEVKP